MTQARDTTPAGDAIAGASAATEATGAQAAAARSSRRRWLHALAWIVCILIVAIVMRALVKQFRQLDWSQVHFDAGYTAAAIACVLGVSIVQLIARWTLLSAYGYPLDWRVQASVS